MPCGTLGADCIRICVIAEWCLAEPWERINADPIASLDELHTARTAINGLIRTTVNHARTAGATWNDIGSALHLDPRDAAARYGLR